MKVIDIMGLGVPLWAAASLLYAIWIIVGLALKKILFVWLRHLTKKTETQLDDILIDAADTPLTLMIFVWGAAVLCHGVLPGLPALWGHVVTLSSKVATIFALVLFVDLLLHNLLTTYSTKVEILRISQAFSSAIVHVVVLSIGLLIILDSLGISITPIIASLGIGSLAVALALQPTLENIFSGFQILLDQPVKPGHFIKLESGEEGIVEKIGWRSSWVRQLSNNMVIIPNKQLVNARIINFNYPSREVGLPIEVGVHYESDLEKVERVTLEVAQKILQTVPGAVADFEPLVRFHRFNSSSIDFIVILRAQDFVDTGLIQHEFLKALAKRYAQEGIVIPYPVTAINTTQEKTTLVGRN